MAFAQKIGKRNRVFKDRKSQCLFTPLPR